MTVTLQDPTGEMGWMVGLLDDEIMKYAYNLTESVDTILLGRKMTDDFISYWSHVINKPNDPWYAFAKKMIETPKVVFTKTLNKSKWINILNASIHSQANVTASR